MCKVKGSAALAIAAAAMMMFLTGCETTKHAEVMSAEELATLAQTSKSQGSGAGSGEQGGIPLAGQGMSEGSLSVGNAGSSASSADMAISSLNPEMPPLPTLGGADTGIDYSGAVGGAGTEGSDVSAGGATSGTQPRSSDLSNLMTEYPTGNKSPAASFGPEAPPQAYLRHGTGTFSGPTGASPEESMGSEVAEAGEAGSTPTGVSPEESMGSEVAEAGEAGPTGFEGQQFVRALKPSDFVPEPPPQPYLGDQGGSFTPSTGTSQASGSGDEEVHVPTHSGSNESMEPLTQSDLGGPQGGSNRLGLEDVFFDFDKYVIRKDGAVTLQADAQLLNAKYQDSSLLIEGHCDARGTRSYNLVLGERRAQAVKDYLVDLGVSASRIQIVSYGKERPFCRESKESCWQQNRRGHLLLQ